MCDSHADWNHAHVLDARRQVFRELVRGEAHHYTEKNEHANPERNIQAAKPEKKALHIPTGALDLLLQRGKVNPLLNRCQPFPVDHDPTVMLHPLPKCHVTGQNPYEATNSIERSPFACLYSRAKSPVA